MVHISTVVAMTLDEAEKILYNEDVRVKIVRAEPKKKSSGEGELRVIRQREIGDNLHELIVSYESYSHN
ncbi:hypothetical protein MFMK1_002075 [Metallumcola ferriviriculae]|uniref:Uncharacterized protein n=1 Tax=Metallumcola ferriviriculae TaxID=3039180 RepID=A0AAU0UPY3_9FIRM|nr:hypothetical protein MFMK1_002075 [Desulfitibacteraceae bacterium MK1]